MKKTLMVLTLSALAFTASAQPIQDEYIVTLNAGADPNVLAAGHGIVPDHVYDKVLNGFAGKIPPGILKKLQADGQVVSIVPNHQVFMVGKPAAGGKPGGGTTPPPAPQVIPAGVTRIGAAPGNLIQTGAGVGVAIVDTGLDFAHADLPIGSVSYNALSPRKTGKDDNGHGTHVGGIVAAKNNSQDVVGVAPGATLYAVKVLNNLGSGSDASIIAGLNWVANNANKVTPKIKVANMSLGRPATANNDSAMETAILNLVNAGITVVVAAGNDQTVEVSQVVPAKFSSVISVASSTALDGVVSGVYGGILADTVSWFTTDGPTVTISAPGEDQENITDTGSITSIGILSTKLGGGTTRMQGTSMASPHVAGVVALLYQQNASLTPANAKIKIANGTGVGSLPLPYATTTGASIPSYSFDGVYEGILYAPTALTP